VSRNRLLDSPDCSLSGDRYRAIITRASGKWPTVKIADIASVLSGGTPSKANGEFWSGSIPWVSPKDMKIDQIYDTEDHISEDAVRNSAVNLVPSRSILCVVRSGILAHSFPVALATRKLTFNQDINAIVIKDERVLPEYLFHLLKEMETEVVQSGVKKGGTVHSLRSRFLHDLAIPLPQIAEQERIVAEMEGYRKIIEGARQVIANYKPRIEIHPKWPMMQVGEVVDFVSGLTLAIPDHEAPDGVPIVSINNISEEGEILLDDVRTIKLPENKKTNFLQKGDLLFNWRNGSTRLVGKTGLWDFAGKYVFASFLLGVRPKSASIDSRYLWTLLNTYRKEGRYQQWMRRNVNGLFNREELRLVTIPLPPLDIQRRIVAEVEAERVLVASNRKLIEIFEAKIKAKLDEVWGTSAEESGVRESPISQSEPAMDLSEPRGVGLADSSSSG
jgi:restriction endonuclease S subunit